MLVKNCLLLVGVFRTFQHKQNENSVRTKSTTNKNLLTVRPFPLCRIRTAAVIGGVALLHLV